MDEWKTSPSVLIETVKVARDFLNAELAKHESWEEYKKVNESINLFQTKAEFGQAKGKQGVGQTTILKLQNSDK